MPQVGYGSRVERSVREWLPQKNCQELRIGRRETAVLQKLPTSALQFVVLQTNNYNNLISTIYSARTEGNRCDNVCTLNLFVCICSMVFYSIVVVLVELLLLPVQAIPTLRQ